MSPFQGSFYFRLGPGASKKRSPPAIFRRPPGLQSDDLISQVSSRDGELESPCCPPYDVVETYGGKNGSSETVSNLCCSDARLMVTDPIPRSAAKRAEYDRSDRLVALGMPGESRLHELALKIEAAMSSDSKAHVRTACNEFLGEAARSFRVPRPPVKVLDARPLRVYETGLSELFGDYQLNNAMIRVWMRTAVQKRVTSFGTFLNTLCHEFCHHLDILQLSLPNSFHTRGFYQRTAVLYHHCRGTPFRPIAWRRIPNNRWTIDWRQMNRIAPATRGNQNNDDGSSV